MKKIIALMTLSSLMLVGCEVSTKQFSSMKYTDKLNVGDLGFMYAFENNNGEKYVFFIDPEKDNFNLELEREYDLSISKEGFINNPNFIIKAKLIQDKN